MGNSVAATPLDLYEQTILSYAALCYAMACELTGNPEEAGDLARRELLRVRQLHESHDGTLGIKMELLAGLWRRFLDGDFGQSCQPIEVERIEATDRPEKRRHMLPFSQGRRAPVLVPRPTSTRRGTRGWVAWHGHSGIGQH